MRHWEAWLPLRGRWLRYAVGAGLIGSGLAAAGFVPASGGGWNPIAGFRLMHWGAITFAFAGALLLLTTPAHPGVPIGQAVAAVSCLASLGITVWCINLALAYARERHSMCGTSIAGIRSELVTLIPLALLAPGAGWWSARGSATACTVARGAAVSAAAAWLTVLAWTHWPR